mgnify:CR=1 FL=1
MNARGLHLHLLPECKGWPEILQLLSACTGLQTSEMEILRSPEGKPRLRNNDLEFSVSHTAGTTAVLVSFEGPVGVDIERSDRRVDVLRTAPRVFEGETLELLRANPDPRSFLKHWTRMEALAKATGKGITGRNLEISPQWITLNLDLGPNWISAAAIPATAASFEIQIKIGRAHV